MQNLIKKIKALFYHPVLTLRQWFSIRALKDGVENISTSTPPFFIIVMSGGLHIADLCLQYVPNNVNAVIILNGVTKWERSWAVSHWNTYRIFSLPFRLHHGAVLDGLFEHFRLPFGILDCDCFVFNPSLFQEISKVDDKTCMKSPFSIELSSLNLELPTTFFLFFNTPIINKIKCTYKVNSPVMSWKDLPFQVKERLLGFGVNENNTPGPPSIRGCFDTLQLIMLLCMIDGYSVEYIRNTTDDTLANCFHVGGGSRVGSLSTTSLWNIRGAYFWRRALDTSSYDELKDYYNYKKIFLKLTPEQILAANPNSGKIKADFFATVELIVSRKTILSVRKDMDKGL